jgi:predicted acetyltransferase
MNADPPRLVSPTTTVRDSYLAGERADCLARGAQTEWLEVLNAASEDFDAFVAERSGVHTRWDVPSTIYWYVSGERYIGTLVVRHRLTTELAEVGGHIGYHVVAPWQRQGHATRMLSAGLVECRRLGLDRVLLTCATENEPSRRVILANGGVFDGQRRGEERYWIDLTPPGSSDDQATAAGTGK